MKAVDNNYTITKSFLILVEGSSDKAMLAEYIRAVGLDFPAYQIMPYNGKNNFKLVWRNIVNQAEFQNVRSLIILRDADDNIEGAFQSVQHYLRNSSIPDDAVPSQALELKESIETGLKVGVFIIPNGESEGGLVKTCFNQAILFS